MPTLQGISRACHALNREAPSFGLAVVCPVLPKEERLPLRPLSSDDRLVISWRAGEIGDRRVVLESRLRREGRSILLVPTVGLDVGLGIMFLRRELLADVLPALTCGGRPSSEKIKRQHHERASGKPTKDATKCAGGAVHLLWVLFSAVPPPTKNKCG